MSLKVIASLFIATSLLVSCASKTKTATPAATTTSTKDSKKATAKAAKAAATTTAAAVKAGAVVCKSGADSRTIEVVTKDAGCEVSYTKEGKATTPASSAHGTAHCDEVKDKIKGKLEAAGYKCE
jgi:hypothetical protein